LVRNLAFDDNVIIESEMLLQHTPSGCCRTPLSRGEFILFIPFLRGEGAKRNACPALAGGCVSSFFSKNYSDAETNLEPSSA